MRADRLLSILMLLQARGHMTASALAEELEVSTRTIYRDIDALSAAGVPVYAELGARGGYSVLEGDSPWKLAGPRDAALIAELAAGHAAAVAETGAVDAKTVAQWRAVAHTGAEIGHTDTLAMPA